MNDHVEEVLSLTRAEIRARSREPPVPPRAAVRHAASRRPPRPHTPCSTQRPPCAALIEGAQKRQCQRQVTPACRVRIGHCYGGASRASGRIPQAVTELEKSARCRKLPAKVATGAMD